MKISFEKLFKWVCTGFLLMMIGMVPIMAIGAVLQPVATATNAIVSFFKGLNGNADMEGIEEGEGIGKSKVIKEENLSHEEWVSLAILCRTHEGRGFVGVSSNAKP